MVKKDELKFSSRGRKLMFKNHKNTLIISIVIIAMVLLVPVSYLFINRVPDGGKIEAISKVKSTITLFGYSGFPDKPGKIKAIIHGGGPSPGIQVPGELETKVNLEFNGTYHVTFLEYWNSKDFKYVGSKDGIQNYFTTFEVKGNEVKFIKSGGDFPPQQVM